MDEQEHPSPILSVPNEDVDDLIFCADSDWYVSDR